MSIGMGNLPFELWQYKISCYLPPRDVVSLGATCRKIRDVLQAISQLSPFGGQMPSVYGKAWIQCLTPLRTNVPVSRNLSIPIVDKECSILASGGGDTICHIRFITTLKQTSINVFRLSSVQKSYKPVLISEINGEVCSPVLNQEGKYLCVGQDKKILMWNLIKTPLKQDPDVLSGHTEAVSSLTFFNQGSSLLTAGALNDGTLRVWDLSSHPPRCSKTVSTNSSELITGIAASEDGSRAYTVTQKGTIQIWDLNSTPHLLVTRTLPSLPGDDFQAVAFCSFTNNLIVQRGTQIDILLVDNDQFGKPDVTPKSKYNRQGKIAIDQGILYSRNQTDIDIWVLRDKSCPYQRMVYRKTYKMLGTELVAISVEEGHATVYKPFNSSLNSCPLIPSDVEERLFATFNLVDLYKFSFGIRRCIYQHLLDIRIKSDGQPSLVSENDVEEFFPVTEEEIALACQHYCVASSIRDWIGIFKNSVEKAPLASLIRKIGRLEASLCSKIYDALYEIHKDRFSSTPPPNYGGLAFHNEEGCSATHKERAEALQRAFPQLASPN